MCRAAALCPLRLCFPWSSITQLNADIVQFGIKVQRMYSAFAADAGKAHSTKSRAQIAQKPAIHPSDADTQFFGDAVAALEIRSPDRTGEPVVCVIGFGDGFCFGIEWRAVASGPEGLFLHAASGFRQTGENRGLDVKAGVAGVVKFRDAAPGDHRGALLASELIVSENFVAMSLGNQGAGGRGLIHGPPDAQGFGFLFE